MDGYCRFNDNSCDFEVMSLYFDIIEVGLRTFPVKF